MSKPDPNTAIYFALFNEIAIIAQLSGSLFERRLPEGFLVSHFAVLNHLVRLGDGRTPLQIARAFQVPKTTMTHTLQGLEKAGLVAVVPNPKDGRSKCVMLTDAGRAFRDQAITDLGPDIARIAAVIAPGRVADVLPLLGDLRAYLDGERNETGGPTPGVRPRPES
ncbi:MarR family winged helix-turn-helix transcriptional regulator [Palleronia sp. KMU-117]|uniref:MarR family winged helix-turn-helix transcriptional regulator n=1 Tax=Palleronia sp. KMU-117 TaxID=3434108 RepID=UPI003D760475